MNHSRRDLARMLPVLMAGSAAAADKRMLTSKVFAYPELPAKPNGQNTGRDVFDFATHTGFPIDLHLTELGPGQAPHPSHKHVHEEIMMLQTGTLDVTISGKTTRIPAGSVVYVASNEEHGWRNAGTTPAQYFVMALGRERA